MKTTSTPQARIEADPSVPLIRIAREFTATPEQVMRAHTDPELFARWAGPASMTNRIDHWDARSGGSWRYTAVRDEDGQRLEFGFHGCFHEIGSHRIVQTFTFDGMPDGVALETMTVEDLGEGRCRLSAQSLVDSFETRDAWLSSGMESGVNEGYAKLDDLLAGAATESEV